MSLDHNRIKVADLEKDLPNQILTTNSNGELEFNDMYNALDCNVEGKALDARQGKELKDLIDNVNALLTSDNVNLNNVQELVDAIETVQTSLNTILVNDLTTGGITKAATAETVKILKGLIDAIATTVNDHLVNANVHTSLFADKEDKIQKGMANGYAPLDAFTKLASQYLNIVNDLETGGTTSLLSAEQGKILKTQINVINTLLTSNDFNLDTVQEIVNAIKTVENSLSTILVNDLTTGGTTKALTAEMGKILKGLIDALTTGKQAFLVSGTNIKTVNGVTLLGSGNIITPDMDTSTAQTISGLKTFLNGMLGWRNAANTFTSFFTNANTASRTYTLQDRNGTLADLTDIASINTGKMNTPAGTANYLSKFLTGTSIGLSRIFDTGTYLGIGTVNTPTKDITLGNQADKVFGIEDSSNIVSGKNLIVSAGRAINYVLGSGFYPNIVRGGLEAMARNTAGDIYALDYYGGYIQVKYANATDFVSTGFAPPIYSNKSNCMAFSPSNNLYLCVNGSLHKRTGNTGSFVDQGVLCQQVAINRITGDVYVTRNGIGVFKQTEETGTFVDQGVAPQNFTGIAIAPNNTVFVTTSTNIIKQVNGTGSFSTHLSQGNMSTALVTSNNNFYCRDYNGNMYMQTNSAGALTQLTTNIFGVNWGVGSIVDDALGNVYAGCYYLPTYLQINNATGTPNLDGGTLKNIAGTGKGTGKSRYEIYTGQKTASGTDMQVETLREYIDENGYHVYVSMPVFADNTAALAASPPLPLGCAYMTPTGVQMRVY